MTRARVLALAFAVLAAATGLYALQAAFEVFGTGAGDFFVNWVYCGIEVLGFVVCAARPLFVREERLAWSMIALNLGLWAAADTSARWRSPTRSFTSRVRSTTASGS